MSELFTMPLQLYKARKQNTHGQLMEFAQEPQRSLYVVRQMILQQVHVDLASLEPAKKREMFHGAFAPAAKAGIRLPQYYVVGEDSPEGAHVVAEKVQPVVFETADKTLLMQQSRKTVQAMVNYLNVAPENGLMLMDMFKPDQFVYGTTRTDETPDFYLVDIDAYMQPKTPLYEMIASEDICTFAEHIGAATGDPDLTTYAVGLLSDCEYMLEVFEE